MFYRMFSAAAFTLTLLVGSSALAADEIGANAHDGKVVSVTGEKLVMTARDGKEHTHVLVADTKACLDGKEIKVAALKAGMWVRVTVKSDQKNVVARIEGIEKNKEFSISQDGKMVSITGDKLVMANKDGKETISTLAQDGKLTIDGKIARFVDLKAGTRIRVTTLGDGKQLTNFIEAIVANEDFEKRS